MSHQSHGLEGKVLVLLLCTLLGRIINGILAPGNFFQIHGYLAIWNSDAVHWPTPISCSLRIEIDFFFFFPRSLAIWTTFTWEDLEHHKAVIQTLVFRTSKMNCIPSLRKKLMKLLVLDIFTFEHRVQQRTTFRTEDKQHRSDFLVLCEMCRNKTTPSCHWKASMGRCV